MNASRHYLAKVTSPASLTADDLLRLNLPDKRIELVRGLPGFKLASDPDTVRAPDVAFIRRERLPAPPPAGYPELAPDLAAEVLSPEDRPGEVLAKVADWLNAGARLVWVVDPRRRRAHIYRQDGSESLLDEQGALDGEDVVTGFTCSLATIF